MKLIIIVSALLLIAGCNGIWKKGAAFEDVNTSELIKNLEETEKRDHQPVTISFEDFDKEAELLLSEVYDSVWYIKLDNSTSALLGDIDRIVFSDSHIFILDRYKTKSIKKFDLKGNYITDIGSQGRGPGEFIEPTDFVIIENKLIVYDQFTHRLLHFNIDGTLIDVQRVPFSFNTFFAFNENEFVFQCFDSDNVHFPEILGYSLIWSDSTFNIKYRGIFTPHEKNIPRLNRGLVHSNGELLFVKPYSDTIYKVKQNGIFIPKYFIDFKQYAMPENEKRRSNNQSNYSYLNNSVQTKDYIYFNFSYKNSIYHCFYSKKEGSLQYFKYMLNDVSIMLSFSNIISNFGDNTLIGYISSHDLYETYERIEEANHLELLDKYRDFKDVKFNDNLVLTFYMLN